MRFLALYLNDLSPILKISHTSIDHPLIMSNSVLKWQYPH